MAKIPFYYESKGLIGDVKNYAPNPLEFLKRGEKEIGDTFLFRLAHRKLLYTNNTEMIEHVLYKNHRNYRKNLAYRKLRALLGDGLFTAEGETWLQHRRLAAPAFRKNDINYYFDVFESFSQQLVQSIQKERTDKVDILSHFTETTLNIIATCLLGVLPEEGKKVVEKHLPFSLNFMLDRIVRPINPPLWFPSHQNKTYKNGVNSLRALMRTIIEEKRSQSNQDEHGDLLTKLIQSTDENNAYSNEQLIDEVLTVFLAGHETSAIALTWTIHHLGQNQDLQRKLKDEIGQSENSVQGIMKCKLLDAVVKEAMRLESPIWILGRESLAEDHIHNYEIKAKQSIIFSPYLLQNNPTNWSETPNLFVPERFLKDTENKAFIPFGLGPRACIGEHFANLEIKTILYHLIKELPLFTSSETHPGYSYSLTLRPRDKVLVQY